MTLGQRILKLRKEKKWSQDVFGEKISIHGKTIARYENDSIVPSAVVIKKMAETFGVTADYLIFGENGEGILSTIQDREVLKRFEKIDKLDDENKTMLIKIIDLFLRDSHSKELYKDLVK
jgi:transcriptional regulator with XRE-family HTH domain